MVGWIFSLEGELPAQRAQRAAVLAYTQHEAPRFAPSRFAPGGARDSRAPRFGSAFADTRTVSPTPGLGHASSG